MELKTRAGLQPVQSEVPYAITTEQAEEFLQKKFDILVSNMNQNGTSQNDVKIMLFTTKCSKKFTPFMIILPLSVLMSKRDRNSGSELDMFNPENADHSAKLKKPFYDLISCYAYNRNDENSFFSNAWRQALGISLKTSHALKANRTPKIQKMNKGQNEFVVCMLDPIRVFHDMLTDINNKDAKFGVDVGTTEKINGGNFRYEVYRVMSKKKKGDRSVEERIAYEINQRIIG